MSALLSVDNLHVRYGDLQALRGVSLTVEEGEVVCIIGPNRRGQVDDACGGGRRRRPRQGRDPPRWP